MKKMIKNPTRLALKVFILIWFFLIVQIVLKLTFNYWQPYVIPTPQLQAISDFIDNNRWLEIICNGILYTINTTIYILCCIRQWWFKNKKQALLVIGLSIIGFTVNILFPNFIVAFVLSIGLPLIIKPKNWLYIILTFILSNLFTALSLWFEGFTNTNDMNYFIKVFFQFDYYIMLVLNYMLFNMIDIYKLIKKTFNRKKE